MPTLPHEPHAPTWRDYLRLARPHQWAKSAFVLIGPIYGMADGAPVNWLALAGAVLAFSLASSACYVFNDIADRDADRFHPRKRLRPVAAGVIALQPARIFGLILIVAAAAAVLLAPNPARLWLAAALAAYLLNVLLYGSFLRHVVILDVISLSAGFVIRVLGGCAAAMVTPSAWLLNCTFFLAMFLAFGKRLGERRTMAGSGELPASARRVQSAYTDDLLRMVVVVTAVATLITYAGYVQDRGHEWVRGFNLLWLSMLPATYGVLRCLLLLERGQYDDPTELATADRPFQLSCLLFALITALIMLWARPLPG